MATKFLEPGGDADFQVASTNGFWSSVFNNLISTIFVHDYHKRSIGFVVGAGGNMQTSVGILADTGSRTSFYFYINALPLSTKGFCNLVDSSSLTVIQVAIKSSGAIGLYNASIASQLGADGPTLAIGQWYRISIAFTASSTTVNRAELFVNGVSAVSVTNATLTRVISSKITFSADSGTADYYFSDIYVDDSNSLVDTGDVWVTAKRPFSNGASIQFTTQIGSGGSGYGSGHSPQVNERPISQTNGWSIQSASKQTEQYTIESLTSGDKDLTGAMIVDYMGWVSCKVGSASTGNIVVNGVASNISVTTSAKIFLAAAGSTTYPSGNTAIGMDTNTINQLFSLYECGILIAYRPPYIIQSYTSVSGGPKILGPGS